MRKRNIVTKEGRRRDLLEQRYASPAPLYQSLDGGTTTDIDKAYKTPHGFPVQVGYSKDLCVPHKCLDISKPISFNPNVPHARETALLARASFNDAVKVDSTIYMDKLEAEAYCRNSIKAVSETINTLKQKTNE